MPKIKKHIMLINLLDYDNKNLEFLLILKYLCKHNNTFKL